MKQYTHLGFDNWLNTSEIDAIQVPTSKPAIRSIQSARESNRLTDFTQGRKIKSIILLKSGMMVLSALSPDTIVSRIEGNDKTEEVKPQAKEKTHEPRRRKGKV